MRLMPQTRVYEPHTPSCMTLIDCMRTKLIHEVYMSLIENVWSPVSSGDMCREEIRDIWFGVFGRDPRCPTYTDSGRACRPAQGSVDNDLLACEAPEMRGVTSSVSTH